MVRYTRRLVEVTLLTVLLLFGGLLMIPSFETPASSDNLYWNHATYVGHHHTLINGEVRYMPYYYYGTPP